MNWRNAGILFLVLIVPVLLILLFKTGSTRLLNLPVFGEKQWNGTDSTDYKIDLKDLIAIPESLQGSHFLLYFSENEEGILQHDAIENLDKIALRLEQAKVHPRNPVTDFHILSLSNSTFKFERPSTWLKYVTAVDINEYVKTKLGNGFGLSDNPIKDHLSYLVDKDGRIRAVYFTAHGKFDKEILGEIAVLQNEYRNK